jgi:hypothetical protein
MNFSNFLQVWIPVVNIEALKSKMMKLMKRAQKLESPIYFATTDQTKTEKKKDETGTEYCIEYRMVEVAGNRPKFNGYTFVATIEPLEGNECLVKAVPGHEIPEHYRKNDLYCDHCHTNRQRNKVFLVQHESGELKQVGSSCLKDFIGHKDPATLVESYFNILDAADFALREFSEFGGSSGYAVYSIERFLAYVHDEAKKNGWTSATKAKEYCTTSTACSAYEFTNGYIRRFHPELYYEPSDEAIPFIENALSWIRAQQKEGASDYFYNLIISCNREVVDARTFSLVASLYATYAKHIEREIQNKKEKTVSNFVGEIKTRQLMTLTLLKVTPTEGYFGTTYMHRFQDIAGNIIVWFASSDTDFNIGGTYSVDATPKKHDIFNEVNQTIVTRVALAKPPKVKKEKVAKAA